MLRIITLIVIISLKYKTIRCIALTALSGLCFQVISKDKSSACSCWLTLPVSRVRGGLLLLTLITLLILQANRSYIYIYIFILYTFMCKLYHMVHCYS